MAGSFLFILGLRNLVSLDVTLVLSGATVILAPFLTGAFLVASLNKSTAAASSEHPSRFLATWRSFRRLGIVPYLLAAPLVVVVIYYKPDFGQYALFASFLELYVVELNLEFLPLRLWRPKTKDLLRASLKSEVDPERNRKQVWSDAAIGYFNTETHSRRMGVRVKSGVNLTVLLFGSEARRITAVEQLVALSEQDDDNGVIYSLASLAGKSTNEILERDSIVEDLNRSKGILLGIALSLVLSYPTLLQLLQTMLGVIAPHT